MLRISLPFRDRSRRMSPLGTRHPLLSWLGPHGLVLLHLLLTVPLALSLNLWIDEAYSLDTTQLGIWAAGREAIVFENQPPLYFMLLSLWRSLGTLLGVASGSAMIGWARLFSVFCLLVTVALMSPLAEYYCPKVPSRWVVAAIALNPYSIWIATDVRTYGFALLLSALLLLAFFDGYLRDKPRRFGWTAFHAGIAIASLYTNYFLGSLLIAQGAVLLLMRRWRSLRIYLGWMTGVSLLFLPMLLVLASHLAGQGSGMDLQTDSSVQALRTMVGRSLLYLWPSEFLAERWSGAGGLRYLGLLGLGGTAWVGRRRWDGMQTGLLVTVAVCFGSLTLVLDVTDNAALAARYSYPLMLPLVLLTFSLLSLLPVRALRRSLWAWGAIALICYGGTLLHQYPGWAKDGDWSRVARYIQAQERDNQPVLVFSAEGILPLKYYYSGRNSLVALPAQMPEQGYNLRQFVIRDAQQVQQVLAMQARPDEAELPREFWLVQGPRYVLEGTGRNACEIWGIDLNCAALEQFVYRYYHPAETQNFYGSQVQRWVLREDGSSSQPPEAPAARAE